MCLKEVDIPTLMPLGKVDQVKASQICDSGHSPKATECAPSRVICKATPISGTLSHPQRKAREQGSKHNDNPP